MTEQRGDLEQAAMIFERARELDGEAREVYLDEACSGDARLREEIQSMIEAHGEQGEFLSEPTQHEPTHDLTQSIDTEQLAERAGTKIGRYKLLQRIGEGGFGVVYMAEQQEPVRRKVALKIIKLGMDTKQVIARFEAERQALAIMEHSNIARVLDAGATGTGRPYFVMELVKGIPITEYCDRNNLSTSERLDLFMPVCHAVQHAHQKGVIHRDIKPSNVMVTLHDGKPIPKVIDFGIAKATDHRLTEKTLFTEYHQFVGTPAYMSPEQAEMSGLDVDTRTDVYSLGVLLYELLTGTTPFDLTALREAGYGEIQRIIREVDPPVPSTRLSTLDAADLALTAQRRRVEGSSLSKLLRGDLDWIVMRALEKDRTRRYETARELAMDVERHLVNEPILASPPGVIYKIRKFVKRNRVAATAVLAVVAALLVGLAFSTVGFVQAGQQRDRAIVAEQQQSRAREQAVAARDAEAKQHEVAVSERDQAIKARQEARQQAYLANIFAARAALSTNEIASVRRRLEAAPEEFRNWEWRYLNAQSDRSLAVLRGHKESIWTVAFSPDGNRVASLSFDETVRLWDASTGKELAVLRGDGGHLACVAFSPDGTRLASGSVAWFDHKGDNTVRVWDAITGQELAVLRGHEGRVRSVAYSPDGTRLASGSDDKTVRLWDVSTGEELAVLPGYDTIEHPIGGGLKGMGVIFSPDGTHLASWAYSDETVRLWDLANGEEWTILRGHEDMVVWAAFSPDGTRLASWSEDHTIRIWDTSTGEERAVCRGHERMSNSGAFSPDGTRLASASKDKTIRLWDAFNGEELAVLRGHEHIVWFVAFSPDGTRLASASSDGTVRLWDASSGEPLAVLRGHEDVVWNTAFSPDGTRIASGSSDGTVRLWDALTEDDPGVLRGHEEAVLHVAISPDGTRLASASGGFGEKSADNSVRLWDPATGEELAVLRGHEDAVWSVAFSPDGTRLASASADKTIRTWNASTGRELEVLRGHEKPVWCTAFSPDGKRLASGSDDKTVRLWDVATGEGLAILRGHGDGVAGVAFSPDGTRVASSSCALGFSDDDDNTIRVWDASTGEPLSVLPNQKWCVSAITFSPDGTQLASAGNDGTVRLWDTVTGEELRVFKGHEAYLSSVAFSPDGTRLAASSKDIIIWDLSTGEDLLVLRGHSSAVREVAFSPDGKWLASGSVDKTVRIWDTTPYRVRYQERQAILAARPAAKAIVNDLWQKLNDWDAIAKHLREDTLLSAPLRRAALNNVLPRAIAHP